MFIRRASHRLFLIVSVMLLLAACQPVREPPTPQAGLSAELLIDGDAVFVNGRPARYGQMIRQGDTVTTGAGASALIRFSDGTTVQLDQNTDPVFTWTQQQLQIRMAVGLIEVTEAGAFEIVTFISDLAEFFSRSRFTVEVKPAHFLRADLFSGEIQLIRPEPGLIVRPGQFVRVAGDGRVAVGQTSTSRVAELRRRLDRWEFVQRDQPPQRTQQEFVPPETPQEPHKQQKQEKIDESLKRWMERNPPGSPY